MSLNYLISIAGKTGAKRDTIHDPVSKLKVSVIDSIKSKFKPQKGEVQYFVTTGTDKIVFETKGYNSHKHLLILQMIAAYCLYLGLLNAQIHAGWPL